MADLTHKEKDELIKELKEKLKEFKKLEKELAITAAELSSQGLSIHKDSKGNFHLVKLSFDVEKNLAAIDTLVNLNSHDPAIALYQAKKYLVEVINKITGNKYA